MREPPAPAAPSQSRASPSTASTAAPRRDAAASPPPWTALDDFWAFPGHEDRDWKWRHGDLMLSRWFTGRGETLAWDSVFLAQWDLVVVRRLDRLLPPMAAGDMLISGLRPVREVSAVVAVDRGDRRPEYDAFLRHVARATAPSRTPCAVNSSGSWRPARSSSLRRHRRARARLPRVQDPRLRPGLRHPARPRHVLPAVVARGARHLRASRTETLVHAWRRRYGCR